MSHAPTPLHSAPPRRGFRRLAGRVAVALLFGAAVTGWPAVAAPSDAPNAQTRPTQVATLSAPAGKTTVSPPTAQADAPSGTPLRVLRGHTGAVTSVAVSADGRQALSGSYDKTLKLWDLTTGKVIRTLSGHGDKVLSVALSPDGKSAISGSTDNTVREWNLATGENTRTLGERRTDTYAPIHSLAFAPDGRTALYGTNANTLELWNPATGESLRTLGTPTGERFSPIYAVAYSPDGRTALCASRDNTLRLWDVESGKAIRSLRGHSADVTSLAIAGDGRTVLSGSWDETLRLWNLATGETIRTLRDPGLDLHAVALAPDGRRALTGSKDNALKQWSLDSGEVVKSFAGHTKPLRAVAFTPDGRYAISGSDDGTLMIWDTPPPESAPAGVAAPATADPSPARPQPVGYIQPDDSAGPLVKAPPRQREEYLANVRKTVLELQQFRTATEISLETADGKGGSATLANLNPTVNSWFLLQLKDAGGKGERIFHLENPEPQGQQILLDERHSGGPVIVSKNSRQGCDLWSSGPKTALDQATESGLAYAPLCDGRLLLRNRVQGHKTSKEWTTDLLRSYVPGGEQITTLVKESIYQDAYLDTSELTARESASDAKSGPAVGAPQPALVHPRYAETYLTAQALGIKTLAPDPRKLRPGQWYAVKDQPGMWISVIQPQLVADEVVESQRQRVKPLEQAEASALEYLIAFDLKTFDLGFAMGTEHPRVDWSDRVPAKVRDNSLPGPDGIGVATPLVNTGLVNPIHANRIAATFIGGFRRYHGAFKGGDLANANRGSHYGFVEQGVVLSKLWPGLATLVVTQDGAVEIKTWRAEDDAGLARVRYARQNGVPIIDFDPESNSSAVGAYVPLSTGSWSGSAEGNERTLRAGLAIQESAAGRFLIYGYFSAATPSAMARVFEAYRTKYAMLLDMNAPEHTYLATYLRDGEQFQPQHLTKAMAEVDRSSNGKVAPRFIGYADNRDFFYLLRKQR